MNGEFIILIGKFWPKLHSESEASKKKTKKIPETTVASICFHWIANILVSNFARKMWKSAFFLFYTLERHVFTGNNSKCLINTTQMMWALCIVVYVNNCLSVRSVREYFVIKIDETRPLHTWIKSFQLTYLITSEWMI